LPQDIKFPREYKSFISNPQNYFLSSMPTQLQATKTMVVMDTFSMHSPNEECLGERDETKWTNHGTTQDF